MIEKLTNGSLWRIRHDGVHASLPRHRLEFITNSDHGFGTAQIEHTIVTVYDDQACAVEALFRNPDDSEAGAVEPQRGAEDVGVGAKVLGPEGVGEDRDGPLAGNVVLVGQEESAFGRIDPENLKVAGRNRSSVDALALELVDALVDAEAEGSGCRGCCGGRKSRI